MKFSTAFSCSIIMIGASVAASAADKPDPGFIPASAALNLDPPAAAGTAKPPFAKPGDPRSPAAPSLDLKPSGPLSNADLGFWRQNWKHIALAYALVGDHYYAFPMYDPRYPSSAHVTVDGWMADHTTTTRVATGNISKSIDHSPPREEAIAAATRLPAFASGQYGSIASAKIVEVVGPQEMIVTDVALVDPQEIAKTKAKYEQMRKSAEATLNSERASEQQQQRQTQQQTRNNSSVAVAQNTNQTQVDQLSRQREQLTSDAAELRQFIKDAAASIEVRQKMLELQTKNSQLKFRVLGYPTGLAVAGTTWKTNEAGMPIALLPDEVPVPGAKPAPGAKLAAPTAAKDKIHTAINVETFSKPMDEADFLKLVQECGMTQAEWISTVREIMKANQGDDRAAIVTAMETARKKAETDAAQAVVTAAADEKKAAADAKKADADAKKAAAVAARQAAADARKAALEAKKSGSATAPAADPAASSDDPKPDKPLNSVEEFRKRSAAAKKAAADAAAAKKAAAAGDAPSDP